MKLNTKALALAGGILWGLAMLVLTLVAMWTGYAEEIMNLMSTVYYGHEMTYVGAIIGGVWGFLDAAIGLAIFGWLYNKLAS